MRIRIPLGATVTKTVTTSAPRLVPANLSQPDRPTHSRPGGEHPSEANGCAP